MKLAVALTVAIGMNGIGTLETVQAAEINETSGIEAVITDNGNIITGTLGANNGIQWTYDKDTKILTMTGDDIDVYSGNLNSPFSNSCADVEKIIVQDCKLRGNVSALFSRLTNLKTVEFDNIDTSGVTDMHAMFSGCNSLTGLDLSGFDTSGVKNMYAMFIGCSSLTGLDLSSFDTSNIKDMSSMFSGCNSLTCLDLSSFDTSNVKDMSSMFYSCNSLTGLELRNFDTSSVTDMGYMFSGCSNLNGLELRNFDTANVTDMRYMFNKCSSLANLDLSNFSTENVTDMLGMFRWCKNLTDLDISGFDTSKVKDMGDMFSCCYSLVNVDVGGFDTSAVTDMGAMFNNCSSLTGLELSNFEISSETSTESMLLGCSSLRKICTPKSMAAETPIALEDTFFDLQQNRRTTITPEVCKNILVKDGIFADVPDDEWYAPYVRKIYAYGYMTGKGNDEAGKIIFQPLANKQREEFAQVLCGMDTMDKSEIVYSGRFIDVKSGDWFAKSVEWAASNGIVSGVGNRKFGVAQKITREQITLMLYRYAEYKGYDTSIRADFSSYVDSEDVSPWAKDAMQWAVGNDILKGKKNNEGNTLVPKGFATRAECATMIVAFVERYE